MPEPKAFRNALEKTANERLRANQSANDQERRVIIESANDIEEKPLTWIWKPWLAKGQFHLLAGRQKMGKTTLALTLAARLSAGKPPFTDAQPVLLALLEDDWEHVLKARLRRAGANMDNVHVIRRVEVIDGNNLQESRLRLESDLGLIAEAAQGRGFSLIVLDPILRVAGQVRDSHNASQLRQALDPVDALAESTGAAILGITHFRKQQAARSGPVLDSIMGSQAWTAVARLVWIALRSQDAGGEFHADQYEYCLGLAASNIGPDLAMIPYDIVADDDVTHVEFGQEQNVSATAMLEEREPSAIEQAVKWIRANIPPGVPVLAAEIKTKTEAAGLAWRTINRAKTECLVESVQRVRQGKRQWYWLRPE